jgi:hypothetical protein
MAKGYEVLELLCPAGGWIITEDDFDSIVWVDERPKCTKEEFENGFVKVDELKAQKEAELQAKKIAARAKLEALGLSLDDLKVLGLG